MFLSEWRKFPSAPCLAGKKKWCELASRCCWNRARPWHASELVSFQFGLGTYQHPVTCTPSHAAFITKYTLFTLTLATCVKIWKCKIIWTQNIISVYWQWDLDTLNIIYVKYRYNFFFVLTVHICYMRYLAHRCILSKFKNFFNWVKFDAVNKK
jgi:hypothetical protein